MPYYGPNESHKDILYERYFLASDVVCGIGYGVQLVLYFSCALFLWKERTRNRFSFFLLAYITVLIIISTIFVGVEANGVQLLYIDNRHYPGGPWAYFLATQYLPVNVIFYATLFVLTFLSDLLVLWRCWVIWRASGRALAYIVTAFPAITILASFAMGTLWTLQSSQRGRSMYSRLPRAFGTTYYAISLAVNILLTVLIMFRLYTYRRRLLKASLPSEHGKHYVSLAALIIESALLYSFFALMFLISYAFQHPINQVFLGTSSSAQQIAGYLIIYRVAQGRAWKNDTQVNKLSTMGFNIPPPPVASVTMPRSQANTPPGTKNETTSALHTVAI